VQRLRPLRGIVSAEVPGISAGVEQLWCPSRTVSREWLYRLRDLFLLLP
jgi:hypothetical protein